MQCELVVLLMLWAVGALSVSGPSIQTNFNISSVNDFSLVSTPLQVPLSLLRNSDPIAHTPIIEKYYINLFHNHTPDIDISHIKTRMLQVDHEILFGVQPPATFFENKNIGEYHLLESMEFSIMFSNPSQLFTVCLIEVFSDCQSIKRDSKRSLPLCINPYTKYPLLFNIYVTAAKNRQAIHSAILFNATIKYQGRVLTNRIWKKQVSFPLLPNHLKLYSFQLRNCKQEHSVISIKNPQKHDLSLLIIYKHKKLYMNNQPFDQKVLVAAGKTFRFMIQGRDATMTIYTSNPEEVNKKYPILYVPLYCQQSLSIEYIPLGILSAPNLALTYPILVTSHSLSHIQITEIELHSSSQAVELIKSPSHKIVVQPNDKFSQIGSFVVHASKKPSFKNTVSIRITCKSTNIQNSSQTIQIIKTLTYIQLYNAIQVGNNRFYDVSLLKDKEYTQNQKIQQFNYTLTNKLQIPIRLQRILFNSQKFRMHWFKFSRAYIYPNQQKEDILLQYIGPKTLPLSPLKYVAVIQLSGGLFIPFETMIYDNTLICLFHGKEDRCSKLKTISFGYQKSDKETQTQQIIIKNQNPTNITFQLRPYALPNKKQLNFTIRFQSPFPYYQNSLKKQNNQTIIQLRSGHTITMIIEVKVNKKATGDLSLLIQTPFQAFSPRLRFHFESGKISFTPELQQISQCDLIHRGTLNLTSSFQDSFTIKEMISNSPKFQFNFNQSQQYEPLQTAFLTYIYNPYKQQNYTDECCGQDFIKNHFINSIINGQETIQQNYEISVITSNQVEQKTAVKVKPFHNLLLKSTNRQTMNFKIIKVNSGGYFCLNISNPYPQPLKYSIYFLSHVVVQKPKDYFTYLKHVKRERTQTYFCIKNQARNLNFINPTSLKQLFRLQQKPSDLLLGKDGILGDFKSAERNNLSNNDYLNSFIKFGNQICYRFTSILYIKLLIQSEVVNDILQNYPFEFTQKLIQREYQHLQDSVFTQFYDQFYTKIALNLDKYCSVPVFPIFRFCQQIPIKLASPLFNTDSTSRKVKRYSRQNSPTRILSKNSSEQICYMLHGHKNIDNFSFQLVIANNYSKHDQYKTQIQLIEAKIKMGDIAFEQNRKINHTTFLKHYFTSLYKALYVQNDITLLKQNGIKDKSNIVPLYFTGQDYDEQFGLFKGQRYFQLINNSPIDIHFTHYGFQNIQKIRFFSGFTIEQVGVPQNTIILKGNSKSTFKIGFHVDKNFNLNITNPILNKNINFYLYNGNHYYIRLIIVIKVVDNIITKMKTQSQSNKYESQSNFGYFLMNMLSLGFICAVITQLKRQEQEKSNKLKIAKERKQKIQNLTQQSVNSTNLQSEVIQTQIKMQKFNKVLSPYSIGSRIETDSQKKHQPYCIISEQDIAFFKTLKLKQDRNIVSDSQSQPQFRLSQHSESDKLRTDEQEKSQISQSAQEIKNYNEQSNLSKTSNNQQLQDEFEEQENESQLEGSQGSITQSLLPDGISVCNDQIDIDDNMQFEFGFGKEKTAKAAQEKGKKGEDEYVYYNVFSSYNPLKKESHQPFPWITQNQKKKPQRPKHRKQE